ncbi:MAG: hypothetical protein ACTSR5_12050 [Promethearchaeota archaeon]
MKENSEKNENIPKISLITASVFMKWMTEGIIEIYQQFGRLFTFKIYFLNDVNDGKIPKQLTFSKKFTKRWKKKIFNYSKKNK